LSVVELLLQDDRVDPTLNNSIALICATESGHADVVRALLEDGRAEPAADDSSARRAAANSVGSSVEVLGLLLEDGRADPNARNYEALKSAFWACDHFLVGMLLNDDRFQPTSLKLKDIYHSTKDAQTIIHPEIDEL
jgi:Ankyrin repeats (3 copies)